MVKCNVLKTFVGSVQRINKFIFKYVCYKLIMERRNVFTLTFTESLMCFLGMS